MFTQTRLFFGRSYLLYGYPNEAVNQVLQTNSSILNVIFKNIYSTMTIPITNLKVYLKDKHQNDKLI